jgi:hypothetical protein
MKKSKNFVFALTLLIVFIALPQHCLAQNNSLNRKEDFDANVLKLLQPSSEWQKHLATFTGKFVPIPTALEQSLDISFAKHRFTIAVMETGLGPNTRGGMRREGVLIVGDKETGKVIGYSWGFGPCSEGFRTILSGYEWTLRDYAYVQLKTLGDLLLYTWTSKRGSSQTSAPRVGRILDQGKGIIDVELILQRTAYRILRVRVQANGKFGRISFFDLDIKQEY